MNKRKILCNNCGKLLFETDKSDGSAGAEAQSLGFVFKMPILYGIDGCFFFCCKSCAHEWYSKNVPKNPKVDEDIQEARRKIPEWSADICRKMEYIKDLFSKKE